ncbi:hypothetical protein [Pseudomonas tohonis]|nr:hypothetical protein [Pseudomonas tohonis]
MEAQLRAAITRHVKGITIGHVTHVKDVLQIRNELQVKVDVEFQDVEGDL